MREDVRITEIKTEVSPEGRRVAVDIIMTPFIERPSLQVRILNASGEKAAALSIVESLDTTVGVVMHLRDQQPTQEYTLQALLYFASPGSERTRQDIHTKEVSFTIPEDTFRQLGQG